MNFRRLRVGDCSGEVRRLHDRLLAQGLEIAPEERKRGYFGPSTRDAVGDFQRTQGIHLSYEVCQKTLAALTSSPAAGEVAPSIVSIAPTPIARTDNAKFFFNKPKLDPLDLSAPVMMIDAETGTAPGKENAEVTSLVNQVRDNRSCPQWRGCNLVGGGAQGSWEQWEGAGTRNPGQGPQKYKDYLFPTNADVDYLISKGMNIFRLLFNHEAIQPEAFADIPYNGNLPNPGRYHDYYNTFKALVDYITLRGKTCLIDIHNAEGKWPDGHVAYYLRQFNMSPNDAQEDGMVLADLWGKLATIFKDNQLVWFGIHNEPTTKWHEWYPVAQAVITAIRKKGSKNKIVMPGVNTDGARDWFQHGADTGWLTLYDPADNMIVQIHTYYDPDNSGTAQIAPNTTYLPDTLNGTPATPTNLGEARLTYVTNWARANGKQVFIGELALSQLDLNGADQTAQMTATWRNTLDFINANADVIIGYAWWEYGHSGWAGNIFDLRPASGADNPRMNIIKTDFVSSVTGGGVRPLRGFSPNAPIWKPRIFKGSRLHSLNFTQTSNQRFYLQKAIGLGAGATHFATFKHTATDVVSSQGVNPPMTLFGYNAAPQIWSAGFSAGTARYVYGSFPREPYPAADYIKGKKFTVVSNSGTQIDWVLVPTRYDTTHSTPMTLFVWLHGRGGRSEFDVNMVSTGTAQNWISLAVGGREQQGWGSLAYSGPKILAAIDYIRSRFNVNSIVLGGYSSGGDLGYALAFQNSDLFSGVIFENTAPGENDAMTLAETATNKFHIAQMVHDKDTLYKPEAVGLKMDTLQSLGFKVEFLVKDGSHFDQNGADYDTPPDCTTAHLRKFMLPFLGAGWVGSLSTSTNYDSAATNLNDGKTHTVCWTHSTAGVLKVYVDGVLNKSWAGVGYNSRALLNIIGGGYKDIDCYSGSLAEAISYNGALTDQNVRDLHSRASQKWF